LTPVKRFRAEAKANICSLYVPIKAPSCDAASHDRLNDRSCPISTSYAERANLTMRMRMRRFTRLTNAFSKKIENHAHAMALFTTCYNSSASIRRFA
jgi:hypothetical protein